MPCEPAAATSPIDRTTRPTTRRPILATPSAGQQADDDEAEAEQARQPADDEQAGRRPPLDRERRQTGGRRVEAGRRGSGVGRIGGGLVGRCGRPRPRSEPAPGVVNAPAADPARTRAGSRPGGRNRSIARSAWSSRPGGPWCGSPTAPGWPAAAMPDAIRPVASRVGGRLPRLAATTGRRSKSLPHQAHSDQSRPTSRLQFGQTRLSRVRQVGQMIHSSSIRRSQVGQWWIASTSASRASSARLRSQTSPIFSCGRTIL